MPEHPLLFPLDHPFVERMRSLCMRYPEAAEAVSHGRVTFRAGRRQFAIVGVAHDDGAAIEFLPDDAERPALLERDGVWIPPYGGAYGWLALAIGTAEDWELAEELVDTSYRQVALQRQLRALDDSPVVRRGDDVSP